MNGRSRTTVRRSESPSATALLRMPRPMHACACGQERRDMNGTFQALVLVGLAVLIAVVIALAVFVMKRQPAAMASRRGVANSAVEASAAPASSALSTVEPSAVAEREAQLAEA